MVSIRAQFGALVDSSSNHVRVADVQVRLGDPKLDNTHGTHRASAVNSVATAPQRRPRRPSHALSGWPPTPATATPSTTTSASRPKPKSAPRKKTPRPTSARKQPQTYIGTPAPPVAVDRAAWEQRVAALSAIFREFPDVYQNAVMLTAQNETDYFVSSEGSRIVTPHRQARLVVFAVTRADDGMDLFRAQTFEAETADGLPAQAEHGSRHPRTRQEP